MFNYFKEEFNISKWITALVCMIVLTFLLAVASYTLFVNYVDNYELGYMYDTRTGNIQVLDRTGYFVTLPIVQKVHSVDLRPFQVCISSNRRILNCKLVEFDRNGLDLFLQWHGRGDYTHMSLEDIMKAYAYDGSNKSYPFLKIIKELKSDENFK